MGMDTRARPRSVGVVGLGPLGLAVARHIRAVIAGPVVGVDPDQRRRGAWETLGGGPAAESIEAMEDADTVVVTVPDADAVIEIARRLAQRGVPPEVLVLSTLAPNVAAVFDAPEGGTGSRCWYVPVTGGEIGALRGRLVAIASASMPDDTEDFLHETIASRVVRVPDSRRAALLKLLGNALIAYEFAGLAATMDAGLAEGVTAEAVLAILAEGSSGSPALAAVHDYALAGLEKDLSLLGTALRPVAAGDGPEGLRHVRDLLQAQPKPDA